MARTRIVHIINSFEFGGAEAMLCNLLLNTDLKRFEPSVVALIDDMTIAAPIIKAGIPLVTMGMQSGIPDPRAVFRLAKHLRLQNPQIIQTWMDHSNLVGGLAAVMVGGSKVVWGVHHSNHVAGVTKKTTMMTVNLSAGLSRMIPEKIILCSEHSQKMYAARGFCNQKMIVIPNGFNTSIFKPDPESRSAIRHEIGIDQSTPLIGLIARYDPNKDHANFLNAAALLIKSNPDVHFLMCGKDVTEQNATLMEQIRSLSLQNHVHLLGPRRDVSRIYSALDINATSSLSEAFPLTVGESMACGVPNVTTDVGDTRLMVGETGIVVPAQNSQLLADGFKKMLELPTSQRAQLSDAARKRVCELFDLTSVTRRYEAVYDQILNRT